MGGVLFFLRLKEFVLEGCITYYCRGIHKKVIVIPTSKFLCSTIATPLKKKKNKKVISVLKEDHQALCLFAEKYSEKQEAFKYLLKNFPRAVSILEGKLLNLSQYCGKIAKTVEEGLCKFN